MLKLYFRAQYHVTSVSMLIEVNQIWFVKITKYGFFEMKFMCEYRRVKIMKPRHNP